MHVGVGWLWVYRPKTYCLCRFTFDSYAWNYHLEGDRCVGLYLKFDLVTSTISGPSLSSELFKGTLTLWSWTPTMILLQHDHRWFKFTRFHLVWFQSYYLSYQKNFMFSYDRAATTNYLGIHETLYSSCKSRFNIIGPWNTLYKAWREIQRPCITGSSSSSF